MQKGYTLIEVLVALVVASVGIMAAFALIQGSVGPLGTASSRFVAAYLAQEGIEIATNIRDSNFLRIRNGDGIVWNAELSACASSTPCKGTYDNGSGTGPVLSTFTPDEKLLIDGNGFYTYDDYGAGTSTKFSRIITVSDVSADQINVVVEVKWEERGQQRALQVQKDLYKWLQ
ncbi:MAG: prepilin-type N-terminal cleavage/methylation domain-containing protein [Candidatus Wildermuthbacteria bacterium]|nr:prepilin-type N-terminal cleavage/methylation domain-containing protein [Candidatus Wildermuthbacteria bacterium]